MVSLFRRCLDGWRWSYWSEVQFGFSPLPIAFLLMVVVIAALYIITAEIVKKVTYEKVRF
jgi:hypothetical protein